MTALALTTLQLSLGLGAFVLLLLAITAFWARRNILRPCPECSKWFPERLELDDEVDAQGLLKVRWTCQACEHTWISREAPKVKASLREETQQSFLPKEVCGLQFELELTDPAGKWPYPGSAILAIGSQRDYSIAGDGQGFPDSTGTYTISPDPSQPNCLSLLIDDGLLGTGLTLNLIFEGPNRGVFMLIDVRLTEGELPGGKFSLL